MPAFAAIEPGNVQELTLERIRRSVRQLVDRNVFLRSTRAEVVEQSDFLADRLVFRLTADLFGREASRQVLDTREVPSTWRDGLRLELSDRIGMSRLGRTALGRRLAARLRRHARTERIETLVKVYHVCPHLDVAYRDEPQIHLHWLRGE
jgi:hypothetical protein